MIVATFSKIDFKYVYTIQYHFKIESFREILPLSLLRYDDFIKKENYFETKLLI